MNALAAQHPDVVKVIYDHYATWMPTIDQATLVAALRTAHQHRLKTVVHVGTWQDVRDALQAGATAVTHVPPDALPADIGPLFLRHGAYFIPALAVQTELAHFARDSSLLDDPLLRAVSSPALRRSYRSESGYSPGLQAFVRWQRQHEATVQQSVRTLGQQGVRLLAGTDAGNPGTFQGYSLHRELELLAAAGLSNWAVLAAATTQASTFFGEPAGFAPGSPANFLVLRQSPVSAVQHARAIDYIIQRGRLIDRQKLLTP
ncbi:amidohydrolase family protein (plasmid) [Hymenobacter sp. 5516J-16]|uniref:amidohydrolase family protein n=1 Tax=Hymenobacter sp. 5516J-16 TaxID=2932253 RepID=UPI001FD4F701|nr:amidohydrolase family protein [Hymenobacter sp. 5516J-16]UOQ79229.1 amidohydrolase family protein [Hymenobacter sp. 5516J-16]